MEAYEDAITFQIECIDKDIPSHELIVVRYSNGVAFRFEDAWGDEIEVALEAEDAAWDFVEAMLPRVFIKKRYSA